MAKAIGTLHRLACAICLVSALGTNALAENPAPQTTATPSRPLTDSRYAKATAALAANQPEAARELLEEVVAEYPEFAGGWLDLALAAYRSGDVDSGLEHLEYLRSHFFLPPALTRQVDYWYKLWQNPSNQTAKQNQWQGELTLGLGHDTNVNAGLASNTLSITLPGGNILFPVDQSSLPNPDNFSLLGLTAWGAGQALGQGSVTPIIILRGKRMQNQNDYDSLDLQAGAVYLQPAEDSGSWRVAGFAQHYRLGGNTLGNALRLNAQRIYRWSNCQISAGGELENRQAVSSNEIGGNLFSLTGGLACSLPGEASLNTLLRIGHTNPRTGWPGGSKNGQELALQYTLPMVGGRLIDITWRTNWLNDQDGYSPLLENNAARRILRQNLTFTLRQPITTEWDAVFTFDALRQHSNLELFRYDAALYMIALARKF